MGFGPNDLHIVVGDVAAGQLTAHLAIPAGSIAVDRDVLTCGPLAPLGDVSDWIALREGFWRDACAPANPPPQQGPAWLIREIDRDRDRFRDAERILLWMGTPLSVHVATGWLIAVFRHLGLDTGRFWLVDLERFRTDRMPVPMIGQIDADLLRRDDTWRPLGADDLAAFETLWRAVSDPAPKELMTCAATSANPVKDAALSFMGRYPTAASGLSRWDACLLEQCSGRMLKAARIVATAMHENIADPDKPGDLYLFHRLKRMGAAALSHPLLEIAGSGASMRSTEVCLTEAGERVLAGTANAIALNGLDDWVGGVRLSATAGNIWLFDGTTLVPGDADGTVHAE